MTNAEPPIPPQPVPNDDARIALDRRAGYEHLEALRTSSPTPQVQPPAPQVFDDAASVGREAIEDDGEESKLQLDEFKWTHGSDVSPEGADAETILQIWEAVEYILPRKLARLVPEMRKDMREKNHRHMELLNIKMLAGLKASKEAQQGANKNRVSKARELDDWIESDIKIHGGRPQLAINSGFVKRLADACKTILAKNVQAESFSNVIGDKDSDVANLLAERLKDARRRAKRDAKKEKLRGHGG